VYWTVASEFNLLFLEPFSHYINVSLTEYTECLPERIGFRSDPSLHLSMAPALWKAATYTRVHLKYTANSELPLLVWKKLRSR
jgi:hypothetical protein